MKLSALCLILMLSAMLILPTFGVQNETFHFNKTAPKNPEIGGNFDIVYFGATPEGDYIKFWMQVRGIIDNNPKDGSLNGYIITIYGNETYEFGVIWLNSQGKINEKIWMAIDGNFTNLNKKDVAVNGNRIIFYIPYNKISKVGNDYHLTVTTLHTNFSSSVIVSDTADYYYNPYSYPSPEKSTSYFWPIIATILIIIIIALAFSIFKRK